MERYNIHQIFASQQINPNEQTLQNNSSSSNPQVSLTTILNEIVKEGIHNQNTELFIKYVTLNFQTFWELLLVINFDESSQNGNHLFIVTEILRTQPEQIFDHLFRFNQIEYMDSMNFLFQTLDRDCIDETIAAYFSKFISSFMQVRGAELWNYLQTNGKYIYEDLMKNLHINHIADIVYNLIAFFNKNDQGQNYNQERLFLLNRTIDILLNKHYDLQIVENVCNILIDLLRNLTDQEFKQMMLDKVYIPDSFFDLIFLTKSHLLADLLIQLLYESQQFTMLSQQYQPDFQFNYQQFEVIGKKFSQALTLDLNLNNFSTSYGVQSEILGQTKIKLIQFYLNILQSNNLTLINYFNHQEILLNLMFFIQQYEFNNQLQNYFMHIIAQIFSNTNLEFLQKQVSYELNILGFLSFLNQEYYKQVGLIRKPITKGYQGMVNKLTAFFKDVIYTEEWNQYIQNHQQILYIEDNYLFGIIPENKKNNQQEDLIKPEQIDKEEEAPQQETENNQPIQINEDQVQQAVVLVENNFQDQSNFGEILGEQILHQIAKQRQNISKSQQIIMSNNFDFSTKFRSLSPTSTQSSNKDKRSKSQERVYKNQKVSITQSFILSRRADINKSQEIIH
ncbi:unnamed protein product [Paramecium octaurelia]|uniref:Uncharacterized protein n=1 Tax=Paramecium octaurelia TaxID=43137 RepID=A0A8S1X168_PAROT|nr:unnamed protein product [Paramecium octaurelia]